jgi:hypothetical protein
VRAAAARSRTGRETKAASISMARPSTTASPARLATRRHPGPVAHIHQYRVIPKAANLTSGATLSALTTRVATVSAPLDYRHAKIGRQISARVFVQDPNPVLASHAAAAASAAPPAEITTAPPLTSSCGLVCQAAIRPAPKAPARTRPASTTTDWPNQVRAAVSARRPGPAPVPERCRDVRSPPSDVRRPSATSGESG